jgi:hypothetical protein
MKLAVCGHGECGKDTVCTWLAQHSPLRYHASTSEAAAQLCFERLAPAYGYANVRAAHQDRRNHREEWAAIIDSYNRPRGITLYCDMLKSQDILNGIRRENEIEALRAHDMLDLVIWIERDVPVDPSVTMTADTADVVVMNNASLRALFIRLARILRVLKVR